MSGFGAGGFPEPGSTVVAESRLQASYLFGFLNLAFLVALVRGETGATTTAGHVAVAVLCGLLIALFTRAWIVIVRRPARLEITGEAIRFVQRDGQVSALSREQGDELRFVKRSRGSPGRIWTLGLAITGTGVVLDFPGFFSMRAVREACRGRGWRFVN
jgi:hypothetical protein